MTERRPDGKRVWENDRFRVVRDYGRNPLFFIESKTRTPVSADDVRALRDTLSAFLKGVPR